MESKIQIHCSCGSEIISLCKFDNEEEIYLSLYTLGQFSLKPTILERIKYCFYHLKTGKIYTDQIILDKNNTKKLINWLKENV